MDFLPGTVPRDGAVTDDKRKLPFPRRGLDGAAPWGCIAGNGTSGDMRQMPCSGINPAAVISGAVALNQAVRYRQGSRAGYAAA